MIHTLDYWLVLFAASVIFWQLPERWRLRFLGGASVAYLLSLEPLGMAGLLGWAALFYYLPDWAKAQAWRRAASTLVLAVLGYLAYFKYVPAVLAVFEHQPLLQRVVIPLGISFYTVKLIHYAVERARGKFPAHRFSDFACYILFFPIFSAGPVERFDAFLANRRHQWDRALAVEGLTRIAHGLIKRFVLAEILLLPRFGLAIGPQGLLASLDEMSVLQVWSFFVLSYLFLYLEFSAYSDIAIGSSRLFGFRICENFHWPVLATNIADFWRRWHMSLSAWCRTYVYLPMIGLTRNPHLAGYASFMAMGLWHAPSINWLAWGVCHASGMAVYTRWAQFRVRRGWKGRSGFFGRVLGWALTFVFVTAVGSIAAMDRAGEASDIVRVFGKMFGLAAL